MGNYVSCASTAVPANTVKVIKMSGGVHEFLKRIKAAEMMLEHPQHFVCHASSLHVGRRIIPLSADEDLELGQLYFLLPMSKLHSALSATDMAAIGFWTNGGTVSAKNAARILPFPMERRREAGLQRLMELEDSEPEVYVPKLSLDDVPDLATALAQLRLGSCRNWRPKLETITESRPKLRDLMLSNEQFC